MAYVPPPSLFSPTEKIRKTGASNSDIVLETEPPREPGGVPTVTERAAPRSDGNAIDIHARIRTSKKQRKMSPKRRSQRLPNAPATQPTFRQRRAALQATIDEASALSVADGDDRELFQPGAIPVDGVTAAERDADIEDPSTVVSNSGTERMNTTASPEDEAPKATVVDDTEVES